MLTVGILTYFPGRYHRADPTVKSIKSWLSLKWPKMARRGLSMVWLWQGVDPLDGSEALRSITMGQDGDFNIVGSESYFSGCGSDRGIVEATGRLEQGVLVTRDFTLTCFEINKVLFVEVSYVPDRRNGTLVEVIGGGFPPVVLHRIGAPR